jgi:hypothetical protein
MGVLTLPARRPLIVLGPLIVTVFWLIGGVLATKLAGQRLCQRDPSLILRTSYIFYESLSLDIAFSHFL